MPHDTDAGSPASHVSPHESFDALEIFGPPRVLTEAEAREALDYIKSHLFGMPSAYRDLLRHTMPQSVLLDMARNVWQLDRNIAEEMLPQAHLCPEGRFWVLRNICRGAMRSQELHMLGLSTPTETGFIDKMGVLTSHLSNSPLLSVGFEAIALTPGQAEVFYALVQGHTFISPGRYPSAKEDAANLASLQEFLEAARRV